jgi:histidyl-tRNA synthetase
MREFYQCDIDVINVDNLPIHFDAEVASVIYEALASLDIGRVQLRISNRKILLGLLEYLEISDPIPVTSFIDKLEKLGEYEIRRLLIEEANVSKGQADQILELASSSDLSSVTPANDMMKDGIDELNFVMAQLSALPDHAAKIDLSIVRGLDYYTGTVYETQLLDVPEFTGSVCSGGRYDDLAGNYINKHLPGVGISIGFTRLFDVLRQTGKIKPASKSPADIVVALPSEERRAVAAETARTLRERGYNVELYHAPQKIGKQIAYTEKKGIPYIWFPPFDDGGTHEIKDMTTGDQGGVDPKTWKPNS